MGRRSAFLRWQCLIRQYSARFDDARPSPGMAPHLLLDGAADAAARPVVLLNRRAEYGTAPEFRQIHRGTQDPRERREAVVRMLASTHYQRPERFSDRLTAIFRPESPLARAAIRSRPCVLRFSEHGQCFVLACRAFLSHPGEYLREETLWFGRIFNPELSPFSTVVVFEPDWCASRTG